MPKRSASSRRSNSCAQLKLSARGAKSNPSFRGAGRLNISVIREENNVYGGAVNIASRISGLSAPGEVLVSDIVRGLARTSAGVGFEDRGEQPLKGVSEAVRVWAVVQNG